MTASFLCPTCRRPLQATTLTCPSGHRFFVKDGVLLLVDPGFARRLQAFLAPFEALRHQESRRLLDPALYPALPYGPAVAGDPEWRQRQLDWEVVRHLLAKGSRLRVLDVGAWNGWLSNRVAEAGHQVTALDYFVDAHDGLGARRFCSAEWQAVQMDMEDLTLVDDRFDVVILNRCLQFFTEPLRSLDQATLLVRNGGLLLATGLALFRDPRRKARQVEAFRTHLRQNGVADLKVMKGYLDFADRKRLLEAGMQFHPYRGLRLANLRARLDAARPWHGYGVLRAS